MSTPATHSDEIIIPRPLLIGAGLFICLVVIMTGISSATGFGQVRAEAPMVVEKVSLVIKDESDGGVGVYDPVTGERTHLLPPESGGFVRTAFRALVTDRRKAGVGSEPPFELQRAESGLFLLHDPSTSKTVTLHAFGEGNAVTFEQLFAAKPGGNQ